MFSSTKMFSSTGTLSYGEGYKLVVSCDQELADYYRSLIPKYYDVQRGRYPAHVTVVRTGKEMPIILENWGKYQGEEIDFLYDPTMRMGEIYFWLNIWCKRLEEIRVELGLSNRSMYTLPPDCPFAKCFHMTVANCK